MQLNYAALPIDLQHQRGGNLGFGLAYGISWEFTGKVHWET